MDDNDRIKFIASHYRKDKFSTDRAWKRLGIDTGLRWHRFKVAAAIAASVVLIATAAVFYRHYSFGSTHLPEQIESTYGSPIETVRVIDFEDTPLSVVVSQINAVYGVTVVNLPDDIDSYRLSLHYKGNAIELVDAINDILGTQMSVEQ